MEQDFTILDNIVLQLTVQEVLRQLGYPPRSRVPAAVREKVRLQIAETQELLEPRGAYLRLGKAPQKGFEPFSRAEGIVLALATIGDALERRAKELVDRQQGAAGLIVDAIGTIAVERTADFLENEVRQDCARCGWEVSRRYAPGFCGWKMEAQREIFRCLPNTLGVALTGGCLMIPEKSLTFVCLLSGDGDFSGIRIGDCAKCRQEACPYRLESYEGKDQRE